MINGVTNQLRFFASNTETPQNVNKFDQFYVLVSTTGNDAQDFIDTLAGPITTTPREWTEYIYNLSAYDGQAVYIAFYAFSAEKEKLYLDDVSIEGYNPCAKPTSLQLDAKSIDNGLSFSWLQGGTETEWKVEWGMPGFTPGTNTEIGSATVTNTNHTISTLNYNDSVDIYVQANCGVAGNSTWTGPLKVHFGHCHYKNQNPSIYYINTFTTANALINLNNISGASTTTDTYSDFAMLPFQIIEGDSATFTIIANDPNSSYGIGIYIDWNKNMIFDSNEKIFDGGAYLPSPVTGKIKIPASVGVGKYRMRVIIDNTDYTLEPCGNKKGEAEDYLLEIVPPVSCVFIEALTATNITRNTADINWQEMGTATVWNIEWGAQGFTPGTGNHLGTAVQNGTNSFQITNLQAGTTYDIYVQADCGNNDLSSWGSRLQITTSCEAITQLPWEENFDQLAILGSGMVPNCFTDIENEFTSENTTTALANGEAKSAPNALTVRYLSKDTLWTPEFNLEAGKLYTFNFWWIGDGTTNWNGSVLVNNSPVGSNATLLNTFTSNATNTGNIYQEVYTCFSPQTTGTYTFGLAVSSGSTANHISFDDFSVTEIQSLGTDGAMDICSTGDVIDLNTVVSIQSAAGAWVYPSAPNAIVQSHYFNPEGLPLGSTTVEYVSTICANDKLEATLTIKSPPDAGNDVAFTVCINQPLELNDKITNSATGNVTWYDQAFTVLNDVDSLSLSQPGSSNFYYVVSNSACPADTAQIGVTVSGLCDWLSIENEHSPELSIYPNPTNGDLNIINPSNVKDLDFVVLDMSGSVVLRNNHALQNSTKATISLQNLEKGIYTLKVFNAHYHRVFKIVKE